MKSSLGRRIKYFRKRAGLSQLELEAELGASSGYISRVESGKVNPNKETIAKISSVLNLRPTEINYILNLGYDDVSEEDIQNAEKTFSTLLNSEKVYAYLLDNKSRIVALSSGFESLARGNGLDPKKLLNHHVAEVLFDPDIARGNFSEEEFEQTAIPVVAVLLQERYFMLQEAWWQELIKRLNNLPDFKRIWNKVQNINLNLFDESSRTVYFCLEGESVPMTYYLIISPEDTRFALLEYKVRKK
jgi:transcriptional regulator with XRE-family HTH domain